MRINVMVFIIILLSVINICLTCYNHYLMNLHEQLKEDSEDSLIRLEFKIQDLEKEYKKNVN